MPWQHRCRSKTVPRARPFVLGVLVDVEVVEIREVRYRRHVVVRIHVFDRVDRYDPHDVSGSILLDSHYDVRCQSRIINVQRFYAAVSDDEDAAAVRADNDIAVVHLICSEYFGIGKSILVVIDLGNIVFLIKDRETSGAADDHGAVTALMNSPDSV